MARISSFLFGVLLTQYALGAQAEAQEPKGFPPSFGVAKAVTQHGKVFLEVKAHTITPFTETAPQERDGKNVQVSKTGYTRLTTTERFLLDPTDAITLSKDGKSVEQILVMNQAKVFRKDGKAVPAQEIPRLFQVERPVLIFGLPEPDPYHLRVLHDDILVIAGGHNLVFPLPLSPMKQD